MAGYLVLAVFLLLHRRHDAWVPLAQLPSLLWLVFWTLGGRWSARLLGRPTDRGDRDSPKT